MNRTFMFILAAAFGLALSTSSLVSAQTQSPPEAGASAQEEVKGKAVSVDETSKSITVTDSASGGDKTFTVKEDKELKDIKPGDNVSVKPEKDNAASAEKVQKE